MSKYRKQHEHFPLEMREYILLDGWEQTAPTESYDFAGLSDRFITSEATNGTLDHQKRDTEPCCRGIWNGWRPDC